MNLKSCTLLPQLIIAHLFPLDAGFNPSLELSSPVLFASRLAAQIFLSSCKFLPEPDCLFMSKIRQVASIELGESSYDYQHSLDQAGPSDFQELLNMQYYPSGVLPTMEPPVTRHVNVSQSPFLHSFYSHYPLCLTMDTGAETNMMRASLARHIGANVTKSSQTALQADGHTPLAVVGKTCLPLIRHGPLSGWVSSLKSTPPQSCLQMLHYGFSLFKSSSHLKPSHTWPQPDIVQSIGGKLRLLNNTEEPLLVYKNNHLCQARLTVLESTSEPSSTQAKPSPKFNAPLSSSVESVHIDPDGLLSSSERNTFVSLLKEFQLVFDSRIPRYNGAASPIKGVVNMGPVEPPPPPQGKGRVP